MNHYLIATGDADEGVTPAARALEEMVDTANKKGFPCCSPHCRRRIPKGKNGHSARTVPKLNEAIRRLARGDEVMIVDLFNGLGGVPDGNIGADGLHPTPAGYDRIAQIWFEAIQKQYEEPGIGADAYVQEDLADAPRRGASVSDE